MSDFWGGYSWTGEGFVPPPSGHVVISGLHAVAEKDWNDGIHPEIDPCLNMQKNLLSGIPYLFQRHHHTSWLTFFLSEIDTFWWNYHIEKHISQVLLHWRIGFFSGETLPISIRWDCWRLIDSLFFSFEEMAVLCFMATLQLDMDRCDAWKPRLRGMDQGGARIQLF